MDDVSSTEEFTMVAAPGEEEEETKVSEEVVADDVLPVSVEIDYALTDDQINAIFKINQVNDELSTDLSNYVFVVSDSDSTLAVFSDMIVARNYSRSKSGSVVTPWCIDPGHSRDTIYVLAADGTNRPSFVTNNKEVAKYVQFHHGRARWIYIDNLDATFAFELDHIPEVTRKKEEEIDFKDLIEEIARDMVN